MLFTIQNSTSFSPFSFRSPNPQFPVTSAVCCLPNLSIDIPHDDYNISLGGCYPPVLVSLNRIHSFFHRWLVMLAHKFGLLLGCWLCLCSRMEMSLSDTGLYPKTKWRKYLCEHRNATPFSLSLSFPKVINHCFT